MSSWCSSRRGKQIDEEKKNGMWCSCGRKKVKYMKIGNFKGSYYECMVCHIRFPNKEAVKSVCFV